ncbi:hypothetical protein I3843_04G173500 [Carya illinoinensis]|uniref:Uncharacterized protein n=1 Tax=Carya illinoinensis TaxID=32201 RepID=A0A922JSK9_CARIL|nr:hypothetical protein I3760_04G182400 [Carya illinoinensis]KAG6671049.1 hypothetical protein I3843_Q018600 [Carya illinoinensis]KAG6719033.1 hypothetical protein I3842_04G183200 [Carya illinoinensis]KAG7984688.1 hypothetical protein I3843_04G173500 [Carya illinoinensis]
MRVLKMLLAVTIVLSLMSIHANQACRILHGEGQTFMHKSLSLGSSQKGSVPDPSASNPCTHIPRPASTINQRTFFGNFLAHFSFESLQKGPNHVPPYVPNPASQIPCSASTISQRVFAGNSMAHSRSGSLQKGQLVPPSGPNPDTHIPRSASMNHLLLNSLQKGTPVTPSSPNPTEP